MYSALFFLSLVASSAAHGWLHQLDIGNDQYNGNEPIEQTPNPAASVIRQIANNLPVKDTTSSDLTCGRSALGPASLVATAAAGDSLQMTWMTLADGGKWFHDVGPMITYLASCGSESCDKFNASEAKWFKIDQQGQEADGTWAQAKLDDGSPAHVTLPSNLKAGNYLLRHEIIALQLAQSEGGAEFYPSCSQLTVTGSGTGAPTESELVSLPGAYKSTDPGILIDVYNMNGKAYQFPGPPVAAFVSGSSSSSSGSITSPPASSPASSSAAPAKTTTAASSTSTGTSTSSSSKKCKGKRRVQRRAIVDEEPQIETDPHADCAQRGPSARPTIHRMSIGPELLASTSHGFPVESQKDSR
ncbi:glycosyl hydrolase family 61-domain-containing protein [Mycena sanguinolenta]|nr:glycosyl hydrolase family 61-domain-containing protein [Mycena sanguinolenta]